MARYRAGASLHRSSESHGAIPPDQLRRARPHRDHRRSEDLRQALDDQRSKEPFTAQHGYPGIRLQREREGCSTHGGQMKRLLLLLFPAVLLAQQADLILSNGKIVTVDERFSIAQAIAIRGDRIVAVGTDLSIAKLGGPKTRKIDLKG